MATRSVLAFWTMSLLLIVVPGPDWAFTLGTGLRGDSVPRAVGGLALGYAVVTLAVAIGVGTLVAGSPAALTVLTLVGGLYLIWHGATTFAHPAAPGASPEARRGRLGTALRGVAVSGLNPKGLLIMLAMLPQFTDPDGAWPPAAQLALLGLTFTLTAAVFYACLGTFAQAVLHARPAVARVLTRGSGAAMVVIGAVLVAERLA